MAKDTPAAEADAPKKKSKKLILIVGLIALATGGGGAGAWYFMKPASSHAEKKAEPEQPPQFLPLESFTVNLISPEGQPQYLQAGLTLKLGHEVKIDAIKERMAEIRNRILLVLSAKKASDLLPVAGKQQLAGELSSAVREVLGDTAGLKPLAKAKKPKRKAEAEENEEKAAGEQDAADKDADQTAADDESKAERKPKKETATHVAKKDLEVLFTSFIIQ
jgi:flagellar FliL protein